MGIRYQPSQWLPSTIVASSLIVLTSTCFLALHTVHTIQAKHNRKPSLKKQPSAFRETVRNILIFNAFSFLNSYVSLAYAFAPIESNTNVCRGFDVYSDLIYLTYNFLIYRTLLSKSKLFDSMEEFTQTHGVIWWIVHILSIISIVLGPLNTYRYTYKIIKSSGEDACIYEGEGGPQTAAPFFFLALIDLFVNACCVLLLFIPLKKATHAKSKEGAIRNVIFSLIGLTSTLGLLLFLGIFEYYSNSPRYVNFKFYVGIWDVLINLVSINLCWPPEFYRKYWKRLIGKRKRSNRSLRNVQGEQKSRSRSGPRSPRSGAQSPVALFRNPAKPDSTQTMDRISSDVKRETRQNRAASRSRTQASMSGDSQIPKAELIASLGNTLPVLSGDLTRGQTTDRIGRGSSRRDLQFSS
ncbi:hypothetical protein AAMO2058_001512700 [Amorphochlora amoebiformis]